MSGRRLLVWFVAAFALALLMFAPLRLVLPRLSLPPGLSATAVEGSLWSGQLRDARWRGTELGDLRLGLSPLPLLAGRQRLRLQAAHASLRLHAGRIRGIDNARGVLPLPAPSGLSLRASLEDASLLFDEAGCREAGGRVRIELTLAGDTLPPMLLAGSPACEGRSGHLALLPEQPTGPMHLEAMLDIDGDGGWRLQTTARTDDPGLRVALLAAGFQEAPGGFSRVDAGHLGGAPGPRSG